MSPVAIPHVCVGTAGSSGYGPDICRFSLLTENQGESLAVHGGDESDNSATITGINVSDSVCHDKHNGQKSAVGLGSARMTKATKPFPRGRLRGCGDTADKKRPSPACGCPPWHEGQAGRWHGPCPDAGKPATGGIPAVSVRRTGYTVQADTASERTPNTPHPSRGRRIAHEPGIASSESFDRREVTNEGVGTARCPTLESSRFSAGRMSTAPNSTSFLSAISRYLGRRRSGRNRKRRPQSVPF